MGYIGVMVTKTPDTDRGLITFLVSHEGLITFLVSHEGLITLPS